jgi:hypothetical protein
MKKKTIIIAIVFAVFCMAQQGMAQPKVLVDVPVFTFESMPEGVHISHTFKVRNIGDTALHIDNVLPP